MEKVELIRSWIMIMARGKGENELKRNNERRLIGSSCPSCECPFVDSGSGFSFSAWRFPKLKFYHLSQRSKYVKIC